MLEIILVALLLGAFFWSVVEESLIIAAVAILLFALSAWFFLDYALPQISLAGVLATGVFYLALGTAWSFWRWRIHARSPSTQADIQEAIQKYNDKGDGDKEFEDSMWFPRSAQPSQNVNTIVTWITLWPFSLLVYVLHDVLQDIGLWIYHQVGQVYVNITRSALPTEMKINKPGQRKETDWEE